VSPEPFSSRTSIWLQGNASAPAVLEIIDPNGRRVWQQTVVHPEGSHRIEWNGTDASGRPVPSGVYYLLARQADRVERRTLHLIR
jgi:flagellar hook assembly protein FlgD